MPDTQHRHPLAAIAFTVAATTCFAVLDTTTGTVVTVVPLVMAVWARYSVQAVLSTAILWPAQGTQLWHTRRLALQVARGLLLLISTFFAFASLAFMPVGEFTAIAMLTPLVITILATTVLREHVPLWQWVFVSGGMVGALCIIQPGGAQFRWSWLLPLGVVVSNSLYQIVTSVLARHDSPSTTHFYTGWVATVLMTLVVPMFWTPLTDWTLWARLLLMGCAGALGHYCLTLAFSRASAASLTPYLYTQVGTAMLLGALVHHHVPDRLGMVGMAIIVACGASSAWMSARKK